MAHSKIPFGFTLEQTLEGHGGDCQITQVAWSPDGDILASCGDDSTVRLWDWKTGDQVRALREHKDSVNCVAWSPAGKTLATGSDDNTVRLWDTNSDKSVGSL